MSTEAFPAERMVRVKLQPGMSELPNAFREMARVANAQGLEGYEFVDADLRMDLDPPESAEDAIVLPQQFFELRFRRRGLPDEARALAGRLVRHADELEG